MARLNKAKIQLLRAMAANNGWLRGSHPLLKDAATVLPLSDAGLIDFKIVTGAVTKEAAYYHQQYVLTSAGLALVATWKARDLAFDVWLDVPEVGEVGLTVWAPNTLEALCTAMNALGMGTGPNAKVPPCRVGESFRWPPEGRS